MIWSHPPTSARVMSRSDTLTSARCSSTSVLSPILDGEGEARSMRTSIPAPPG